ncbi:hypothetical protein GCM10007079_06050 [Nocardiopsis terrae]|uniref:Uncharacterized protein n=1 Tax=Nocardiopsis terrae TaxID=372655 RepID=A0ABR9HNP7_9ACTN|nr:hypothetical protein [Nocardiopsis terrae]MBE1460653.1 hypothetical protein [Nocardiopsis terrae]GHC72672.1 hypothetical protein GCM10007079_06050 [Nocardiopsis terrae]
MSGFEPTEAQTGVGYNFMTLIDPDAIPYPETDTWSLNYAAETLRTGGQELGSITESMETTWQGLQEHYEAPESETLFAAVGPVATIGEGLEGDLATVATALEELAEAAAEARRKLNSLRIEAQVFVRGLEDRKCWWLTKDEDNDDWSIDTNFGLKSDVNSAWSDFTAAEIACANTITGVFGGATFSNPDDATGADNELVYGESLLIFDPGEDSRSAAHAVAAWSLDNVTEWAGQELNPESVEFDNSNVQAAWDTIALGCVWGPVQGAVTKTGYWHKQNGWASNNEEYLDNLEMAWTDTALDAGELFGVRNEDGWLYDYRSDDPTENLSWDWWLGNAKNSLGEVWEGHSAWSKRESDPAYTGTHTAINTAMLVTGPVKLGIEVLNLGNGRSGDGTGAEDGPYGGQGWGPGVGESDREIADIIGEGRTPISERLGDVLEQTPTLPPIAPDRPSTPTPGQAPTNQGPAQQDSTQQGSNQPDPRPTTAPPVNGRDGQGNEPRQPRSEESSHDDDRQGHGPGDEERRGNDSPTPVTKDSNQTTGEHKNSRTEYRVEREDREEPTRPISEEQHPERPPGRRNDEQGQTGQEKTGSESRTRQDEEPAPPPEADAGGSGNGNRDGEPPRTGGEDGDGDGDNDRDGSDNYPQDRPEPTHPDNRKPDHDGPMPPELRPALKESIQQVPGFKQLGFNDKDFANLFNSLENKRSSTGAQTADIILQGRLSKVEGFSEIIASLKNKNDLPARNQEMRIALDLLDSGFPPDRVSFPGKNQRTGEDLDVAARRDGGAIEYGYQAKVVENPEGIRSALRKIKKQFPETSDASHRAGIIEANFNIDQLLDRDLKPLHDAIRKQNISFHIHFQDGTLDFPPGSSIYPNR